MRREGRSTRFSFRQITRKRAASGAGEICSADASPLDLRRRGGGRLRGGVAFAAAVPPGPLFDSEELARGKFLIASPHSGGPYFHQSVVLLLEYGPLGAMGLIINRPTEVEFAQLFPDDETLKGRSERAFFGGPVERQRLLWLFRSSAPPPESRRVIGDIHVSGSIETLHAVVASGDASSHFRVYVGLAGWAPGQLEGEVARGGWLVAASDARAVFEMDSGKIWREFIERSFRLQAAAGSPASASSCGAKYDRSGSLPADGRAEVRLGRGRSVRYPDPRYGPSSASAGSSASAAARSWTMKAGRSSSSAASLAT